MPRVRRRAKGKRAGITALQWAYLTDQWQEGEPVPEGSNSFEPFTWDSEAQCRRSGHVTIREAWELARVEILEEWAKANPGTRPSAWWTWDAPEARRRLGGTGTAAFDALAYTERLHRGIPADWVESWQVEMYNGCAIDVDGVPIGTEYSEGHFPHDAIDPNDPPRFESEADYLERLGLLTEEEARLYVLGELDRDPECVEATPAAS